MSIFIFIWIIWFLSEVFLNRIFRAGNNSSENLDKNSLRIIWITIFISITSGVLANNFIPARILTSFPVGYIGLVLILIGMLIRFIAIRTLGRFFTVNLDINEKHQLVRKGLYKYVRHPSYTGSLLSFLGLGISLNNWISLAVIFLPVLLVFLYRINIEEKLLLAQPGLDYKNYKRQTKRLIPLIY